MPTKKAGSKALNPKRGSGRRSASSGKARNERPVLKLPLVGKIKRGDIRKAVIAVFEEKAKAKARAES